MDHGNDQLLTSWKEIAGHLGKGVRTVQRWERELGLPVRRPAQSRHIVVALTGELDQWILRLSQTQATPCCSCNEQLKRAERTIVELREQILTMELEMESVLVQLNANVRTMPSPVQVSGASRGKSDGNAA
jgi:hypothetical protein